MACIERVLQFDEEFIIINQYPPTISLVKLMTAPLSPLTIGQSFQLFSSTCSTITNEKIGKFRVVCNETVCAILINYNYCDNLYKPYSDMLEQDVMKVFLVLPAL